MSAVDFSGTGLVSCLLLCACHQDYLQHCSTIIIRDVAKISSCSARVSDTQTRNIERPDEAILGPFLVHDATHCQTSIWEQKQYRSRQIAIKL